MKLALEHSNSKKVEVYYFMLLTKPLKYLSININSLLLNVFMTKVFIKITLKN